MKLRHKRKQFWWTWHYRTHLYPYYSKLYGMWDWGVAKIIHQIKE